MPESAGADTPPASRQQLRAAAIEVLSGNDLGDWTKPAPRLYPHQWSWDSAFIAIGLVHLDPDRALRELETLFHAQWSDGRVPHIVFNPEAADYFPGPDRWAAAACSAAAPRTPATSGIVQPPAHALAAWLVWSHLRERAPFVARFQALYPRLLDWHRYLATRRDPRGSGLLTIYHPWESGADNSPRWDEPLARVVVGEVSPYVRHDLKHVTDRSERPTQVEYDRYLWLVESLKQVGYDDEAAHRSHPFLVQDVFLSAIFALASDALARLGEALGRPSAEIEDLRVWSTRSARAVEQSWDADDRLALDFDLRADSRIHVQTSAGFAPLLLPTVSRTLSDAVVRELFGPRFVGAPGFRFGVIPSTAPGSPGFRARTYWRGPSWPVVDWLYSWTLGQHGYEAQSAALRDADLGLLSQPGAEFAEYFDCFTGAPLGSHQQSWTAAVAIDWLSQLAPAPA